MTARNGRRQPWFEAGLSSEVARLQFGVLMICKLSTCDEGIMSNENALKSASFEGASAPLQNPRYQKLGKMF